MQNAKLNEPSYALFDFDKNVEKAQRSMVIAHDEVLCDEITPLAVLDGLQAQVLLESAYSETGRGRYSIVLVNEAFRCYKEGANYILASGDDKKNVDCKSDVLHTLIKFAQSIESDCMKYIYDKEKIGFLDVLAFVRMLAPNPLKSCIHAAISQECLHSLPLPLGGAGYIGYEFFAEIESVNFSNPPLYQAPECAFIFGRDFLVFDHLFDKLHIVSVSYAYEEDIDVRARVQNLKQILQELPVRLGNKNKQEQKKETHEIIYSTSQVEYETMVRKIKKSIYAGDMLQCVPSQNMQIASSLHPLQAYRYLRHQNPSPYMFYYNFGDFIILGASPEIMIRLQTREDGTFFTLRPIAGTRPRGKNVAEDKELESDLLNDEKERAEHLMLLDLARNDAGKVSVGGGVRVVEQNRIERYSRVMHIVSEVQGELDTKHFFKRDAFKAAFPAGTLTGAPKIEAIKHIESLESYARGVYGGAIGYFSHNEDMDFAIAIRTAVYQNGIYYLRSGAGVVQDSDPNFEFVETQNKMRSMLDMLFV